MSKPNRIVVALYQRSIRLYPRQFREEFGPDLGGLVADQLHDEPSWRVAARSVVDLALTVPTRHVEARMNRTPTQLVPLSFGALALASLVVGLVVGHPLVFVVCIALGGIAACLGIVAASRTRALTDPRPASVHWWKLVASGGGLMIALIVITTATGELPEGGWIVAMITGLTAIILMSIGVLLGIAQLASRPSRRATI
jgi:hypothetical protein